MTADGPAKRTRKQAPPCVICFGAGGHAAVVIDLLRILARSGALTIAGIVASDNGEPPVLGIPVLGRDEDISAIVADTGATHFVVGIGTTAGPALLRRKVYEKAREAGLSPFTAIHPSATVAESAVIGSGTVVMAGAVIQPRVHVGANAIINTGALIDHDCRIGDHSHLAPGVVCSGGVAIGPDVHVGTGATVIQNVEIGAGATIGAGAVVLKPVKAGLTVVGNPARELVRRPAGR